MEDAVIRYKKIEYDLIAEIAYGNSLSKGNPFVIGNIYSPIKELLEKFDKDLDIINIEKVIFQGRRSCAPLYEYYPESCAEEYDVYAYTLQVPPQFKAYARERCSKLTFYSSYLTLTEQCRPFFSSYTALNKQHHRDTLESLLDHICYKMQFVPRDKPIEINIFPRAERLLYSIPSIVVPPPKTFEKEMLGILVLDEAIDIVGEESMTSHIRCLLLPTPEFDQYCKQAITCTQGESQQGETNLETEPTSSEFQKWFTFKDLNISSGDLVTLVIQDKIPVYTLSNTLDPLEVKKIGDEYWLGENLAFFTIEMVGLFKREDIVALGIPIKEEQPEDISNKLPGNSDVSKPEKPHLGKVEYYFIRDGYQWEIKYKKEFAKVKHTKGMLYIAHLLQNIGKEIPLLELISITERISSDVNLYETMNSGQLEAEGLTLYSPNSFINNKFNEKTIQQAIEEAQDELDRAEEKGIQEEIEEAKNHLQIIKVWQNQFMDKDPGFEKARKAITGLIITARKNIRKLLPECGRHIEMCLTVGNNPSYKPQSDISWRVEK
jgi:hypothetical protein